MATSAANRGKTAEKTVKDILNKFNDNVAGFTFNRNLDAHAAGGRFPAQAGDFQAFVKGSYHFTESEKGFHALWSRHPDGAPANRNFIIEVKEVKHDFRLPAKNYSADKVARVQKRVWAGTEAAVAVLHTTTGLWRLVPFEVFTVRAPSWDLSGYAPADIELALGKFMGVN